MVPISAPPSWCLATTVHPISIASASVERDGLQLDPEFVEHLLESRRLDVIL